MPAELLSGRILITGASGGLGAAIARAFAAHGARLLLSGRRLAVLEQLASELGGEALAADLSVAKEVESLAARAGAVDVLVANAALPASGRLTEFSAAQIDAILDVNLRSQVTLTAALLPGMLERGRGQLVFISSLSGKAASPSASLYNATKFGLRGFALGLREDLRGTGVDSSVIMPGFVRDAGMFAQSGAKLPPGAGTSTPAQVAAAVIRSVRHDRAEVRVAPVQMWLGAEIAGFVPELAGRLQRRLGSQRVAARIAAGQLDKRPPG